jgi:hypothetical protein
MSKLLEFLVIFSVFLNTSNLIIQPIFSKQDLTFTNHYCYFAKIKKKFAFKEEQNLFKKV